MCRCPVQLLEFPFRRFEVFFSFLFFSFSFILYKIPLIFFTVKSFVKYVFLKFIKEFPLKFIEDLQQKNLQKNSLQFWSGFILQRIPLENIFSMEILCKIFLKFQTWIGFFSTFFLQNQKTRKLWKFTHLDLQVCQVSAKSETKKFFTSLHSLHFTHFTSLHSLHFTHYDHSLRSFSS